MNAENIQQEHIYNEHIQDFSSLSKKIKEDENLPPLFDETKDESIYNTVVDFYAAKFLIAYGTSQEKGIDKVLKKELDKTKEAAQKLGDKAKQQLESEVQKRLKDYIEGGVEDVSIYGNHASITLEDNKKEFKISEFLNSDFCQKNGISGFSTLHSDGTSGMHGFVAEEGKEKEKRKVRHYVVTDGSYEMTLNWYANGEKCTIKINIDKDGIDLVERNGITDDQLKANKDVKIGGLFLHQIQFREKGQEKEVQYGKGGNQVQHEAYETVIKSDIGKEVKKSAQKHQATHMNRGIGSQTPPLPPPRISSLNKDISDKKRDLDHQNDGQRNEQEKLTPKVQQQEKGGDLFQDIRNFKKNNLQHVDGRKTLIEKSDKNDSSIDIKTNDSGYSSPITDQSQFQVDPKSLTRKLEALNHKEEDKLSGEYGKNSKDHDTEKNIPKDPLSENILQKIKEDKPIYKWLKDKIEGKEGNQNLDALEEKLSQKSNVPKDSSSENVLQEIKEDKPIYKWLKDKIEGKEDNQNLDALEEKLSQKSGQGNIVEKRENDGGKPLSTDGNEEVWYDALEDLTGLDEDEYFDAVEDLNEQKINQSTNPADQAMDKQEVEHNSDRSTSPVNTEENVDVEQSKDTLLTEFTSKLDKETKKFPLKPVDQKEMSEQTRERLLKDGLLKDDSTDVKKVAEQENADTNPTIDKNSELSKLLARDEKQLKVGVIEEEREDTLVEHTNSYDRNRIALGNKNRLLWTKHVKQQQENKDKGISI